MHATTLHPALEFKYFFQVKLLLFGKAELWTHGLDAWTLDDETHGLWKTGRLDSGLQNLGPRIFYAFLVTSNFFLLLFTVEHLKLVSAIFIKFLFFTK